MRVEDLDAVFFDFDGVILESVNVKTRAFRQIYEERAPEIADEVERFHLANGGMSRFDKFRHWEEELLGRPLSRADMDSLCDWFSALVFDGVCRSRYVKGAEQLIRRLSDRVPLHIVSATPHEEIGRIVDQIQLSARFRSVNGSPTPKVDWLRTLLDRGELEPASTLMIGDAVTDQEAATMAGVPFIGRCGELPGHPFDESKCLAIVGDLEELDALLSDA